MASTESGRERALDPKVKELMQRVRAEVERKKVAGVYPPELLEELDSTLGKPIDIAGLKASLSALKLRIPFSIEAPITSSRPALKPVVSNVKRMIRRSVAWYLASIFEQINSFASQSVQLMDQLISRFEDMERRVDELEAIVRTGRESSNVR